MRFSHVFPRCHELHSHKIWSTGKGRRGTAHAFSYFVISHTRGLQRQLIWPLIQVCLSIYLSIYPPIYLSIYLSICLSVYLSIYPSIYLSVRPSIHPPIHPSIHPPTHPSVRLSVRPPTVRLSVCLLDPPE